VRSDGTVDHLWIRVADLDASVRFYEELGARAGVEVANRHPGERVHFRQAEGRGGGSFGLVAGGTPTRGLLLAFHGPGSETLTDPDGTIVQLGG
jgi:catechol 2,3-dioxygenase-like lactoylglutathione lyase family enzyme